MVLSRDEELSLRLDLSQEGATKLAALAKLRAMRLKNEKRFEAHPWPWLCEAVWTSDPFSGGLHKYPGESVLDPAHGCACQRGGCQNYLHHIVNTWWKEPRTAWPKSRRLLTSWTMIACHEWLARYRAGQVIAFVSRKQGQNDDEGSAELIKRAHFIGQHLPVEVMPRRVEKTWCRLSYPHNGSVILGIAQGADQLRQLAVTAWFGDEFAFWEQAGSTYAASLPSLEGSGGSAGRCTLVSTANPGFFQHLCQDTWQVSRG